MVYVLMTGCSTGDWELLVFAAFCLEMSANPPVTLLNILFEIFSFHCIVKYWSRGTVMTSSIGHVTKIFETLKTIQISVYDISLERGTKELFNEPKTNFVR